MHAGAEVRRKAEQAAAAAFAAEQPSEGEEEQQDEEQDEGSEDEGSEQSGSEQEGSEAESEEEGEYAAERRAKKRKLRHGTAAGGGKAEDEGIELFKGQREQRGAAGLASPAAAFVDHEAQVGASMWRAVSATTALRGPLRKGSALA